MMRSGSAVKQATQMLLLLVIQDINIQADERVLFSKCFRHRALIESHSGWPASITFSDRPQAVSSEDQKNPSV